MKKYRIIIFLAYIFVVLWLTLIDRQVGERRAMFVPFWEYANVVNGVERSFYIKQILGNLVMLISFGIMLPMIIRVSWKKVFLIGLSFSVLVVFTAELLSCILIAYSVTCDDRRRHDRHCCDHRRRCDCCRDYCC